MTINKARVLDKAESVLKQMENKMEEQLNLPSAKHNVRLNPGNSEGESLSLGCCTGSQEMPQGYCRSFRFY
jgi:hypothetical protein